jgi:hypothetical protein
MVVSDVPCRTAAVYTTNKVKGAPIYVTRENLAQTGGIAKAVIVNSKNANTCNIDGIEKAKVKRAQSHAKTAGHIRRGVEQQQCIARRHPGQHRGHRGEIDGRDKPADDIGVLGADDRFCVVNDAVDLDVFCRKICKIKSADDHDDTADQPGCNADEHIAARVIENILRLEEDTGADHDSHDHTDGGKQTVALVKLIVFQRLDPFSQNRTRLLYHKSAQSSRLFGIFLRAQIEKYRIL